MTAHRTNAERKADSEGIFVREIDPDNPALEEELRVKAEALYDMFGAALGLYETVNMAHDDPEDHTYLVLVDHSRNVVIQSTDPHAKHRLAWGDGHEDERTGSKHEVAVARRLSAGNPEDYDVLPHTDRENWL